MRTRWCPDCKQANGHHPNCPSYDDDDFISADDWDEYGDYLYEQQRDWELEESDEPNRG